MFIPLFFYIKFLSQLNKSPLILFLVCLDNNIDQLVTWFGGGGTFMVCLFSWGLVLFEER